jgi:hypothetical protein
MTLRRLSVLTALLAVLVTAGCAGTSGSGDTSAGAPAPAPSPSPADPSVPSDPSDPSGKPPPGAAGAETISGTVAAGVEPGCLLLADKLLIIEDQALRAQAKVGAEVTVTGRADPAMMTTCQQGTPFVVTSLRPN